MVKNLKENNVGPHKRKKVINYLNRELRRKTFSKRNTIYRKQEEWGSNCYQEKFKETIPCRCS